MDKDTLKVNELLKKYGGGTSTPQAQADPEMDAIFNKVAPAELKPIVPEQKTATGFIGNVGKSGVDLLKNVVTALVHPVQTVKGLGNLALGAGEKVLGIDGQASKTVDQIVDYYKTRYGKDLKETLYNDPVGVLADLSTIIGGAGVALKGIGTVGKLTTLGEISGAGQTALRYGAKAGEIAKVVDPLSLGVRGAGAISKETGLATTLAKAKDFTKSIFSTSEKVAKTAEKTTEMGLKDKLLYSNIDDQTKTILRQPLKGEKPAQTAARLEKDYIKYSAVEDAYKVNPKVDNALQVVGSEIGNGYKSIIKKRDELGTMLSKAKKESTSLVDIKPAQERLITSLKENGIIPTARGYKIGANGTRLTTREINQLSTAQKELVKLGKNPTAEAISNYKARIGKDVDFAKPLGAKQTDAERILKNIYYTLDEGLNVKNAPDLQGVYALNKEYSRLTNLLKEGEGILGKKTLSGDFKHDAGLAKASVKSLHSGGKKDFLVALGKETGDDYIQKAYTAAQAMKDAGNYQQASLLEELATGMAGANDQLRLSIGKGGLRPSAIFREGIDKVTGKVIEKAAGEPKTRTLRYIKNAEETGKGKVRQPTIIPPTTTRKVLNSAFNQLGYGKNGKQYRTRNAVINKATSED